MNHNTLKQDRRRVTSVETVVAIAIIELLMTEAAPSLLRTRNQSQGRLMTNGCRNMDSGTDQGLVRIGKPDCPDLEDAFDC
jgi:hypothetical protein